jgi:2-amino-4-hydroxy-6-hydroxymethyldihydropteridine diphosphokinase
VGGPSETGVGAGRRAFLGLGSNVGNSREFLQGAIARLKDADGVNFLRASRVYRTEPMGVTEQPEFLNMVVEIEVAAQIAARDLLKLVKQIEKDVGRKHRERWGPREIDIDVLLLGDERVIEQDFEVPHPRMWERAFVVVPLAELAPGLATPTGETTGKLAERLSREQGVHADVQL